MQTGTFKVGQGGGSHFMGKFGYGLGTGHYAVRLKLREQSQLQLQEPIDSLKTMSFDLFLDEHWDKVEAMDSCEDRRSYSKKKQTVHLVPGQWSAMHDGRLTQNIRPHIWYFVAGDCAVSKDPDALIDYEIHMTQADGSEFSVEMRQMMVWNIMALICLTFFLVRYASRCRDFVQSAGQLHLVIRLLSLAIALQYVGQVFHTLHLYNYQSNGRGFILVDLCSEISFMLSQVVQTALLIAIAMGYTILPVRSSQLDVVKWIASLSLVIHVVLVSFGKLQDESACKYHENEGAVGWVLLSVRLLLFAWFVIATQASQQQGGLRLHDFFQRFRIAGSLYFVAYPLLFVIVQVFAPYLQHPIMQIGLLLMQTASDVWLAELFLSRGTYFKVSTLSSSFLPSAACNAFMFDKAS